MRAVLAFVALCAALPSPAAERWRMQYFYEADEAEFVITGLAFPSPSLGMAVGYLDSERKDRPYGVSTSDGGKTWTPLTLPEPAVTLFLLNEKTGWLLGRDNLWRTADFGRTWTKLARVPGALQLWFVSEQRGWAAGIKKSLYETSDGGGTWRKVPAAAEPKTTEDYTIYGAIAFANPRTGMVSGWSRPPRKGEKGQEPQWVDPDHSSREWPGVAIALQTQDGGDHWAVSETSMFGQITALSFAPDGRGLGLVEFFEKFDYPSEVYRVEAGATSVTRAFRRRDRVITDVLMEPQGAAYVAGYEPPGSVFRSPIPGKLKILKSTDLENWQEMDIDYRAVARRAQLASAGGRVWAATDTGMILALAAE